MRQKWTGTLIPKINSKPISEFTLQCMSLTFSAQLMTVQLYPKRNSGPKNTWKDLFYHPFAETIQSSGMTSSFHQCNVFQEYQIAKQGLVMSEVVHMNLSVFLPLMYYIRFTSIALNSKLRINALCKSTLHARFGYCSPRHCNIAHSYSAEETCLSFTYSTEKNRSAGRWESVWRNQFLVKNALEEALVTTSISTADCRMDTDYAEVVFLHVATEHKLWQ